MNYTENTANQAKAVFLRAANYIRKNGWQVKGMGKNGGPRCSMGALASAKRGKWDKNLAKLMYEQLYKELNGITLTEFNYLHKSGEEVARLFEATAKSLDRTARTSS